MVYGMEAVLPVEVEVQSMRVLAEAKLPESEWAAQRFEQLALLDEKRMKSLHHMQIYQKRLARAFNKKVRPTKIKKGDLVLKQSRPSTTYPRGKFRPNCNYKISGNTTLENLYKTNIHHFPQVVNLVG